MPLDMSKFTLVQTAKYSVLHPKTGCKPMKPITVAAKKPAVVAPAKHAAHASPKKKAAPAPKKPTDDDDDDLFGDDDDEEEDEAAKAAAKKRADAAKAKKKADKPKPVERSQFVIEVKPWEAECDLDALAAKIKQLKVEGVTWGVNHKLIPVAFGIKKLMVQCVVIDELVLEADVTEAIEQFEDEVQSVDVASMNKL